MKEALNKWGKKFLTETNPKHMVAENAVINFEGSYTSDNIYVIEVSDGTVRAVYMGTLAELVAEILEEEEANG